MRAGKQEWISFLVIALFVAALHIYNTTGFVVLDNIQVGIKEKTEGKILYIEHEPSINITSRLNITTEFRNTGSTQYVAKTELFVYDYYHNGYLNLTASYFDSSVSLNPGMRRPYKTVFAPLKTGIYYIKVKVSFSTRVAEMWSVFTVPSNVVNTTTTATTTVLVVTPSPGAAAAGGGLGPSAPIIIEPPSLGIPNMAILYPDTVDIYQNQSIIINITVNNTGERPLHNLKLFIASPDILNIEVSPKVVPTLNRKETQLFLISLSTSFAPAGRYNIEFDAVSDEINIGRSASLNILPVNIEIKEDLKFKMVNYRLLILEIEQKALSVSLKGFNIEEAQGSIDAAEIFLEESKRLYENGEYERANTALENAKFHIENSVLQLAQVEIVVHAQPPTQDYVVLGIIPLAAAVSYAIFARGSGLRRPKSLKKEEE